MSPAEVWVTSGLLQGQGLWVEKQTLGGHKQKLVCTRTREKGAVTPQETDPALPIECPGVWGAVWVSGGLLQGWGH